MLLAFTVTGITPPLQATKSNFLGDDAVGMFVGGSNIMPPKYHICVNGKCD
jgi:hypothetical protein